MDRYIVRISTLQLDSTKKWMVFDRQRGMADNGYAIASCRDPDDAQRIVDALNARVTA